MSNIQLTEVFVSSVAKLAQALLIKTAITFSQIVGRRKITWRRYDDLRIEFNSGKPTPSIAKNCLSIVFLGGGYAWRLYLLPYGVWTKNLGAKGITIHAKVWLDGPLCVRCEEKSLIVRTIGRVIKRQKRLCYIDGRQHPPKFDQRSFHVTTRKAMKIIGKYI